MLPPAPRDTAQKWATFGVVALVVVASSYGSHALKESLASSLPQPESRGTVMLTTAPVAPPPPTLPTQVPSDPDLGAAPADDPPMAIGGTPQQSLAARPSWGKLDEVEEADAPTLQYAPQHSRARELFDESSETGGDLDSAFIVCRGHSVVNLRGRSGLDEPHVRATFGKTPEVAANGYAGTAYVSAPLVRMRGNDATEVTVYVGLEGARTRRSTIKRPYGGVLPNNELIECRVLAGDALQARLAADLGRADSAIARVGRAEIRASSDDPWWGYPLEAIDRAQRYTADAAALAGWHDARVKKRVAAIAAARARVDADTARAFDELRRDATKEARVDDVEMKLAGITCARKKDEDPGCTLKLDVANVGDESVHWMNVRIYAATKTGPDSDTLDDEDDVRPLEIAAGAKTVVTLTTPAEVGWQPAIAVLCVRGTCKPLRIR